MTPSYVRVRRLLLLFVAALVPCLLCVTAASAAAITAVSPAEGQVVSEGATVQFSFRKDGDWTIATAPGLMNVYVSGVQTSAPLTLTQDPVDARLYTSNAVVVTCPAESPCRQLASAPASATFSVACSADCGGQFTPNVTTHFTLLPTPPPIAVQFQPGSLRQGAFTRFGIQVAPGAVGARDVNATWYREGVVATPPTAIPLSSSTMGAVNGWSPQNMQSGHWRVVVADAHTNEPLFSSDFVVAPPSVSVLFGPTNVMVGQWVNLDLAIAAGQSGDRMLDVTWYRGSVSTAGGTWARTIKQSDTHYARDSIRPTQPGSWKVLVTDWTGTVYAHNFVVSPMVAAPRLGTPKLSNVTRRGKLRQVVRVRICGPAGAITTEIAGTYKLGSSVITRQTLTFTGSQRSGCRLWTYSWNVSDKWLGAGRRTFRVQTTDRFGQRSNATSASFTVVD